MALTVIKVNQPSQPTKSLSIYLSIYLKSQDYGDVGAEAQQGRLTM